MKNRRTLIAGFGLAFAFGRFGLFGRNAAAEDKATATPPVEVKMLNVNEAGDEMVFEPALVRIPVGGSVRFLPTTGGHNAASIRTMMPEGAKLFYGKIDEDITVRFDVEGIHAIQCSPHYSQGMVMLVVAGNTTNIEAIRAVRISGAAGSRFRKMLSQIQ